MVAGLCAFGDFERPLVEGVRLVGTGPIYGGRVLEPSGEGELKRYGRAMKVDDQIRDGCPEAWWVGRPAEAASVFSLNIEQATFISWDTEHGEMTIRRWSPQLGHTEAGRSYP
jgi:hypothetical protein